MLVFHVHTLYLKIEYRTGSRLTIGRRSVYLLPQDLCWLFTLSCSASFTSALAEWRNRFLLLLTLHTSLIPAVNGCFAIICRYHSGADIRIGLRCSRLICEPCAVWPTSKSSLFSAFKSRKFRFAPLLFSLTHKWKCIKSTNFIEHL